MTKDGINKWTNEMDDALIDEYMYQQTQGNRIGGTYTTRALEDIVKVLKCKFPDKPINKDKAQNRMKTIKKAFNRCYDVFKDGMSSFSWDPVLEMWDAEPEVWEKLIEAHPDAIEWKNKRVRNYLKLVSLYGQDRASREHTECATDIRRKRVRDANSTTTIDGIDFMISQNEMSLDNTMDQMDDSVNVGAHENVFEEHVTPNKGVRNEDVFDNPTSSRAKKRKRTEVDEISAMTNSMDKVVTTISKANKDLVYIFKPRSLNKDFNMWKYVEDIGMEKDQYHIACNYLLANPEKFETLDTMPAEHRKNMLLLWITKP